MLTRQFLGINFWNGSTAQLLQSADTEGGLFTVPSAPSLSMMRTDTLLAKAYQSSDWAVVDGGYVALVLRLVFGINLPRISGLQILQRLVGEETKRAIPFHDRTVLWVVPSDKEQERISYFLENSGFAAKNHHWYKAPFYQTDTDFHDQQLEILAKDKNPDWIVLCIGGGRQEKLGLYLRSKANPGGTTGFPAGEMTRDLPRKNGPVILCTGGAISFLSGGQANIPTWADRLYLGWFFRILQNPKSFLPRYLEAAWGFPRLLWAWRNNDFKGV